MKIFLIFLTILLEPLSAKDSLVHGDVPAAPDDGIYDPDQWLLSDARAENVQYISLAKSKWKAEIYVLILPESPEVEEAILAKEVAEKWGEGRLWGVVMHVISDPESPLFFSGRKDSFGWDEGQEEGFTQSLDKALADVKIRASREGNQRLQVQTGTRELCDELGYLGLVMARIDKRYHKARGDSFDAFREKHMNRHYLKKLAMVLVPLILLITAMVIYTTKKKLDELKSNFLFPETSPRLRFLAPWSGGGDVTVKIGSRVREDGSREGMIG